jgi:ribonuclease HI
VELSKLQRVACLGITGAIKTTPTAAMEVLLGLPPLHLQVEPEAMIGSYRLRCNEQWKPKSEGLGHAHMARDMEKEPILQRGSDKMILIHVYDNPSLSDFLIEVNGKRDFNPTETGVLIWFTYGSKTEKGTGAGVCCHGTRRKLSFSLGQHTTVLQAEVYAIRACINENLDRGYKNRNICILSDSQATIKALGKYQITSKLVWDCHQSLIDLARHNRVQLIWVPGHEGIAGNKSEHPFTGPEPACSISSGAARKAVINWLNRKHTKQWNPYWTQTGKGTYIRTFCQKTRDLLKLNRDQLRWIVGYTQDTVI